MFDLIFNKDDSFFFLKKIELFRGAPQEDDAKFRFAINPQAIRQFHDNCKMPDCCHIGACLEHSMLNLIFNKEDRTFQDNHCCPYI